MFPACLCYRTQMNLIIIFENLIIRFNHYMYTDNQIKESRSFLEPKCGTCFNIYTSKLKTKQERKTQDTAVLQPPCVGKHSKQTNNWK